MQSKHIIIIQCVERIELQLHIFLPAYIIVISMATGDRRVPACFAYLWICKMITNARTWLEKTKDEKKRKDLIELINGYGISVQFYMEDARSTLYKEGEDTSVHKPFKLKAKLFVPYQEFAQKQLSLMHTRFEKNDGTEEELRVLVTYEIPMAQMIITANTQ